MKWQSSSLTNLQQHRPSGRHLQRSVMDPSSWIHTQKHDTTHTTTSFGRQSDSIGASKLRAVRGRVLLVPGVEGFVDPPRRTHSPRHPIHNPRPETCPHSQLSPDRRVPSEQTDQHTPQRMDGNKNERNKTLRWTPRPPERPPPEGGSDEGATRTSSGSCPSNSLWM